MMKMQEVYDKVCEHLLRQNATSMSGFECQYRGDNGMKCAIGALIPDEVYNAFEGEGMSLEGEDICFLLDREPRIYNLFDLGEDRDGKKNHETLMGRLLIDLQVIHDHREVEEWPQLLRAVALQYGLEPRA